MSPPSLSALRRLLRPAALALALASGTALVTGAAPASAALVPPAVPPHGVYLGAWVNPGKLGANTHQEIQQLGQFEAAFGRPPGVVHVFQSWAQPVTLNTMNAATVDGSVPVVDWHCGIADEAIVNGSQDALITSFAQEMVNYARPVFLRWYWEPNFPNSESFAKCIGVAGPQGYVAAWRHIWSIFQQVGATNVAFVWCPGINGVQDTLDQYYPGDAYVNWIGVDGYDRHQTKAPTFKKVFGAYYATWSTHNKPMMIGETGATSDQAAYLQGVGEALPSLFPQIKALLYFDAKSSFDWTLTSTGLPAFAALGQRPYFGFLAPNG